MKSLVFGSLSSRELFNIETASKLGVLGVMMVILLSVNKTESAATCDQ